MKAFYRHSVPWLEGHSMSWLLPSVSLPFSRPQQLPSLLSGMPGAAYLIYLGIAMLRSRKMELR